VYELPDGQTIDPLAARYKVPEAMFNPMSIEVSRGEGKKGRPEWSKTASERISAAPRPWRELFLCKTHHDEEGMIIMLFDVVKMTRYLTSFPCRQPEYLPVFSVTQHAGLMSVSVSKGEGSRWKKNHIEN
jgi:hypothetical protein